MVRTKPGKTVLNDPREAHSIVIIDKKASQLNLDRVRLAIGLSESSTNKGRF